MIEYRVCWSASSNISFRGASEWEQWYDDDATPDDVENTLTRGNGGADDALSMALEFSGFECWVEVRVAERAR